MKGHANSKELDMKLTFADGLGNNYWCEDGLFKIRIKGTSDYTVIGQIIKVNNLNIFFKNEKANGIFKKTMSWSVIPQVFRHCDGIWIHAFEQDFKVLTNDIRFVHNPPIKRKTRGEYKLDLPLTLWKDKKIILV